MLELEDYAEKYSTVSMTRSPPGALTMTLHTEGDSIRWGVVPHEEVYFALLDVAADRENRVVVLTGTGEQFCGPKRAEGSQVPVRTAQQIDEIYFIGKNLQLNLLNIEVPMI